MTARLVDATSSTSSSQLRPAPSSMSATRLSKPFQYCGRPGEHAQRRVGVAGDVREHVAHGPAGQQRRCRRIDRRPSSAGRRIESLLRVVEGVDSSRDARSGRSRRHRSRATTVALTWQASTMQIAMIGLGRMGANMVRRLMDGGHDCVVHDVAEEPIAELEAAGASGARTLEAVIAALERPRHVWIMVPAAFVGSTVDRLAPLIEPDDTIIDGGNSWYRDDVDRAERLRAGFGINYLDVGTSGGIHGLERGYCLMVGGDTDGGRPHGSDLRHARARRRRRRAHAGAIRRPGDGRARLAALRPVRRRPLRQDGAQRDRVRPDGGLRRGLQRARQGRHRPRRPSRRRRDGAARRRQVLPIRPRPGVDRRGLATRQRGRRAGCSTSPPRRWSPTRSSSSTPAT